MFDTILQQSPLIQVDLSHLADAAEVQLEEFAFHGHLNLRGRSDNADFMHITNKILGVEPPPQPNTWLISGDLKLYWLGPDEWLVLTPPGEESALEKKLNDALEGVFASVTDVSSGQTILRISGSKARNVLQKGCSFDLHPTVFKQGDCAQTLLAKAGMLISCVDDTPTFDLVVRRSFSDYIGLWLLDATDEFVG